MREGARHIGAMAMGDTSKVVEPAAGFGGDPQVEDGFTRIANELLEAINKTPFTGAEQKVIFALIRQTYGFNKKADRISFSRIAAATGLHRITVAQAIGSLVEAKVVARVAGSARHIGTWKLNKHYLEWHLSVSLEANRLSVSPQTNTESVSLEANSTVSLEANRWPKSVSPGATHKRQVLKDNTKDIGPMSEAIPQREMFGALTEVTMSDARLMRKKLGGISKQLLEACYTPEQVRAWYGPGGWWYREDWRGQKGQPPTPEQIVSTIAQATSFSEPPSIPIIKADTDGTFRIPVGAAVNGRREGRR